jgi:hypothetical protein
LVPPRPTAAGSLSADGYARHLRCSTYAWLLGAAVLAALPSAARASQQGAIAMQKWKAMDACAVQAQAAFPDFTAEANAKRDAKLKECLASQNLPPRQPISPTR